ncbi:MAG: hypothetical protein ACLTZY_02490 [Alistipes indistinctus]
MNDLKYRYVKMCGESRKETDGIEAIFREDKRKAVRNTIRNRVERYETGVKLRADQLEQERLSRSAKRMSYSKMQGN